MKLSVIISNRNDISMLVVTIRSCIEELRPLGQGNGEIVVVDNSDPNVYEYIRAAVPSGYLRDGTLKMFRQLKPCLFSAREMAVSKAIGDYIFCLDSHMLVGRDCFLDSVNFMDRRSDDPTLGFGHPPISWAHQHESRARHDRDISQHELGPWGSAYDHEQTITWKGMPWICRREWFLDKETGLGGYGALAEHRVSWGGGDMHIGVKPWLLGFKNWAIPTNPCIHIGPFPKVDLPKESPNDTFVAKNPLGERYRLYSNSGAFPHTFGFLVSCFVLGGEPMMKRNKKALQEHFGKYLKIDEYWQRAMEIGRNEREWLLKRQKMSFEQLLQLKPWNSNGISEDLQRVAV